MDEEINNQKNNLYTNNFFNKNSNVIDIRHSNLSGKIDFSLFLDAKKIICSYNNITEIIGLNNKVEYLDCSDNKIISLDNLPNSLIILNCNLNYITSLDNLPNSLKKLNCINNLIKTLDNLPNSLEILYCCLNQIKKLDNLPNSIKHLFCDINSDLDFIELEKLYPNIKINTIIKAK